MHPERRFLRAFAGASSLIVFAAATSTLVSAATVRGKVGCSVAGKQATDKYVTVFNARIGRSKQGAVGANGMFYLYNIPADSYVLEVWSRSNPSLPAQTFRLKVLEPYTNVPVVTVSC